MRISVNLATRPFVELRPLFARLRIAMAVLALLGIGLIIGLRIMSKRVHAAEAQMRGLKTQTSVLVNERQANESRMRQPANQAVLERSRFLNDVFQRKSFSWTAVMMDLENVLPAGVQVTSIAPEITQDGDVNIHLRVSGERDREVDLIRNLERSQRFVAPRLVNESAQSQDQSNRPAAPGLTAGAVDFDILSGYNPLPAPKSAAQNEKAAPPSERQKPVSTAKRRVPQPTASVPPTEHKTAQPTATVPPAPQGGGR